MTMFHLAHIQNYFAHLNPIALKISLDIKETQSSYGQFWNQLSASEQRNIINESLIKPELTLRYYCNLSTNASPTTGQHDSSFLPDKNGEQPAQQEQLANWALDGRDLRTFTLQQVDLKLHDDVVGDEHSHPFSYRTKSQLNLQLFETPPVNSSRVLEISNDYSDLIPIRQQKKISTFYAYRQHVNDVNISNDNDDNLALLSGEKNSVNLYTKFANSIKAKNVTQKKKKQYYRRKSTTANGVESVGEVEGEYDVIFTDIIREEKKKTVWSADEEQIELLHDNDDSIAVGVKSFDFLNNW